MEINKFYIDGKFVDPDGSEKIDIVNPATEEVVGHVISGSNKDVDLAVAAANKAFPKAMALTLDQRKKILKEILDGMEERREDFAQIISQEMGSPIKMARRAQYGSGTIHFKNTLSVIDRFDFQEVHGNITINKLPIGPVGMITPWNWPLNQMCTKVASAIAAGTTFVLKPSEITPGAAYILAEVIDKTSMPKGMFNLIYGLGVTVGKAMSSHSDLEMISFTGSTRAGIDIQKSAADNIKRVSLELGGKSPNIILKDVDLENAVTMGIKQCFLNTGQSCSSPTRMLLPEHMLNEATKYAVAAANDMSTGNPLDEEIYLGPISNKTQYKKVQDLIQKGIDEGATLACGGIGRPDGLEKGFFVRPTVFTNVDNKMTIAREEIFGPVLSILKYESEDEAIEIANDTEYGLAGYVQSGDEDHAKQVARKIRAGQISINGGARGPAAPFGGFKTSGNGREHGLSGLNECLETKAIIGN